MFDRSLAALKDAPDFLVLTDDEVCALGGFSKDTLFRLDKQGLGPPRVQISARRKGRPLGLYRQWLQKQAITSVEQPA